MNDGLRMCQANLIRYRPNGHWDAVGAGDGDLRYGTRSSYDFTGALEVLCTAGHGANRPRHIISLRTVY